MGLFFFPVGFKIMPIIRVKHDKENPYFILNRRCVEDNRLSFKAAGIHAYLMSKPDNWTIQEDELAERHTDGTTSVRNGLAELRKFGYLKVVQLRKDTQFAGVELFVLEVPDEPEMNPKNADNPQTGDPGIDPAKDLSDNPQTGDPVVREIAPIKNKESLVNKERALPCSCLEERGFNLSEEIIEIKPQTYSEKAALYLHDKLAEKNKILRKPKIKDWVWWIDKLFKESEISGERFDKVLKWYCDNIGREFVPHAFSAMGFVDKFVQIEAQMEIQVGKGKEYVPKDEYCVEVVYSERTNEELKELIRRREEEDE